VDPVSVLSEFESKLRELSAAEAVQMLVRALNDGRDFETGLSFKIGPGGNLETAPTFRVWMLDRLGRQDPAAAAVYSQRIYQAGTSPDEWALALRNDYRNGATSGGLDVVRTRMLEMLERPDWATSPSIGFLEALDIGVATVAWETMPRLEEWLRDPQFKLRAAASLAIDRMAMEAPIDFIPAMMSQNWLDKQPLLRPTVVARANLAREEERLVVEAYLIRPDLSLTEGERYFAIVPNVTASFSYNLVSTPRVPTVRQVAQLDQASLDVVREWRYNPKLAKWSAHLANAELRLLESVSSAKRAGYLFK